MSEDFDKDGLMLKKSGSQKGEKKKTFAKKWTVVYVNLIGGALHYYKDEEDAEPKETIELRNFKLNTEPREGTTKQYLISLANEKFDYVFALEEESEWKQWVEAISKNMTKDPLPPLKKEKAQGRAKSLAFRAKKNIAGKAATSSLGKKAIKAKAPEEVKNLLNAVKNIVERESQSQKKAKEIEKNVFKIGVKCYFLIDSNSITLEQLLAADKPLREGLELLSKCHDHAKYSRNPNVDLLREKLNEVQNSLNEAATILTKIVTPHMKEQNVLKIKETLNYLGNPDRLLKIFQDEALEDDLHELIAAADHYTQFHFYDE